TDALELVRDEQPRVEGRVQLVVLLEPEDRRADQAPVDDPECRRTRPGRGETRQADREHVPRAVRRAAAARAAGAQQLERHVRQPRLRLRRPLLLRPEGVSLVEWPETSPPPARRFRGRAAGAGRWLP